MNRKQTFSIVTFLLVLIFAIPLYAQDIGSVNTDYIDHRLDNISTLIDFNNQKQTQSGTFLLVQTSSSPSPKIDKNTDDFDDEFDDEEDMEAVDAVPDPLYYFNYTMYGFNDFFYLYLLEPVAKGYKFITPTPVRTGVKNFFHNLLFPVRFVSNLLQFEISDAGKEVGIFVVNTTAGVLGIGQVAQNSLDWHTADEDLGQTFGVWGIDNGLYVVWPILGPSTLRDTIGMVGDSFLKPVNYVDPWELSLGITAYDTINTTSFRIGDYSALVDGAIDPYEAIKNAYIQNRQGQVEK